MTLTLGEWEFILTKITSSIGLIPSIILIIIYFHREEWTFAMSLNFNLSISCIIFMISYLFPLVNNPNGTITCRIQVFLGSFGDTSCLIFTTVITLMANITFKYHQLLKDDKTKKIITLTIIAISYLIPTIISSIFFLFGDVGKVQDNHYCWIRNYDIKLYYGIVIIFFFLINLLSMLKLLCYIKSIIKNSYGNQNSLFKTYFIKLLLYVLVQIIIYLPTVFHSLSRVLNTEIIYEKVPFWLDIILQLVRSLEGLIFPIVYCYNRKILKEIKLLFKCKLGKKKKTKYKVITDYENEQNEEEKKYYSFDPTDLQIPSCETTYTS